MRELHLTNALKRSLLGYWYCCIYKKGMSKQYFYRDFVCVLPGINFSINYSVVCAVDPLTHGSFANIPNHMHKHMMKQSMWQGRMEGKQQ